MEKKSSMNFRDYTKSEIQAIVQLFVSVFTNSEGPAEGGLIGKLAVDLFETTLPADLFNFVAEADSQIIASIFFSRLNVKPNIKAFMLSPVAVHTRHQGKGVGQALINYGLKKLTDDGVSVVLTYGDPNFYQKVGFHQISYDSIRPPYKLTQPHGWLGQSLCDDPIDELSGLVSCVEALNNPVYW